MVKSVVEMKVVCPEERDSKMEELLQQLEAEGWTEIEHIDEEEKGKGLSPIEEAHRLLKEYDVSLSGKIGAKQGSISYKQLQQKTKEFLGLQATVDRRLYLEETSLIKGADFLFSKLERLTKRPIITIAPTEEVFAQYFDVSGELMQILDQAHKYYGERMDGVKSYKDGRVLKLFVESMDKRKVIEADMQKVNKTFAKTGEQLSKITKSHEDFAKLYIGYNNLRREVKGLANELEKTCQRIVIKNEEMYIMSEYEERIGNAVAIFDRERAYLGDIIEHAKETFSIYQFSRELNTGVASIHSAVSSLSKMVYTFAGRVLQSSQEIARMEAQMEKERILPKILDRLTRDYGISLVGPKGYTASFVDAATSIAASAGIA